MKSIRQLLNNIYEFGAPTDGEYVEAVEDALSKLVGDEAGVTTVTAPLPAHSIDDDFQHFLSYSGFGISQTPYVIELLRQAYAAAWEPSSTDEIVKANQRVADLESAIITHFLVTAIPISSMRRTERALYDLVSYRLNEGAGRDVKKGI